MQTFLESANDKYAKLGHILLKTSKIYFNYYEIYITNHWQNFIHYKAY